MNSWKREPINLPILHSLQQLLQRDAPLVERGAYDRSDDASNFRELRNVIFPTHAATGDGWQDLCNGRGAFEGGPGIHAVAGDVGVEGGGYAVFGELAGEIQYLPAALPLPAVGRHNPVARVHGHDEGIAHLFYRPQPELAVEDRRRAHDEASCPRLPQGP